MSNFNDIPKRSLPYRSGIAGIEYLDKLSSMQIGQGSKVLKADQSGLWLGANTFASAPFKVDMEGNVTATTLSATYLSKTGEDQTLSGDIQVGNGQVLIDGGNKRIIINDGTNDRVLIGYHSAGF